MDKIIKRNKQKTRNKNLFKIQIHYIIYTLIVKIKNRFRNDKRLKIINKELYRQIKGNKLLLKKMLMLDSQKLLINLIYF